MHVLYMHYTVFVCIYAVIYYSTASVENFNHKIFNYV